MLDIDVRVKVRVRQIDGEDVPLGADDPFLTVRSHEDFESFVTVSIKGAAFTVNGAELRAAIARCERGA